MEEFLRRLKPLWEPHTGQREFLTNDSRIKVLSCGRRWGKTDACAVEIVAALHQSSPTKHVILAPTQDQANLLMDRVCELLQAVIEPLGEAAPEFRFKRTPYPRLTFGPHRVTARSGFLARALRGNEATHLVVDEAAYVPESLITEVAMPMLATTNGQMTLISTPNGRNHFWKFFGYGMTGEHGVWSRRAPSEESPYVSKTFLAIQRDLIPERAYAIEYEAEFRDSVGQFFRTEAIEACIVVEPPRYEGHAVIGVDWGRMQDATAVAVVKGTPEGASLVELQSFNEAAWVTIENRVRDIIVRYPNCTIVADATGGGEIVVQSLNRMFPNQTVIPFVFNNKNKNEILDSLLLMFEKRRLLMSPHPDLMRELQHYQATMSHAGNRKLGSPEGLHDDLVTALALAVSGLRSGAGMRLVLGSERSFLGANRSG